MANLFAGGPPSDECGWTGGDNEVWKLAKDGAHYRAMEKVLKHHYCEDYKRLCFDVLPGFFSSIFWGLF